VVLLDEHGQEVGVNQIGEITVKSRFLTPGYWRMPELTQSKFQPDSTDPNRRVYRTGDLGYFLPDGCLVPVGRTDSQIKIRGYRIEIGEIEAALLKIKIVKDAAVAVKEDHQKGKHLIAYLIPCDQEKPSANELRRLLTGTLPDYMIPVTFVYLPALPLIGAGKIDRRALAQLEGEVAAVETDFVGPRTSLEKQVTQIWEEVLGLAQVGVHDNFFDLGGHSLLATRVVSRVRQEFHVDLKLMDFFKMPTIAELTKGLEGLLWVTAGKPSEDEAESQAREEGVV
jgi:acyl carrier protein